jgi:chaperonin GroEL
MADLLALTLGPIAGYVVNEGSTKNRPELLDDSAVIARRILSLECAEEDVGAMLMRHLVWRVGEEAGDGGATAAVLARAIYKDALRLVTAGASPVMVEKGIKKAAEVVVEALRQQACAISNETQLAAIARMVVGEDSLAAVLGEMSYLLGADAHVIIENYMSEFLERRYINGTHYPAQISSMHFYTEPEHKRAVVTDAAIALTDEAINDADQAINLMQAALTLGKTSLVIVAPRISDKASGILIANHRSPDVKLSILGVSLKDSGDDRHYAYADLSLLTGAKLLAGAYERSTGTARPEDLGAVSRVEISRDGLIVVAGGYTKPEVRAELEKVRARLAEMLMDDESRPTMVKRLAALTGGVGELKIGALSDKERKIRRSQAERALKVLSLAQRGGVVPGGGAALCHCRAALKNLDLEGDAGLGAQVMERALSAPLRQLLENAMLEHASVIIAEVGKHGSPYTYDVMTGKIVDAHQAGIIDSTDGLIAVVTKAASIAMSALMTDTIIYHRNPQMEKLTP